MRKLVSRKSAIAPKGPLRPPFCASALRRHEIAAGAPLVVGFELTASTCRRLEQGKAMREHRYSVDLPHSPERLWAVMQDYDRWTDYAPMVLEVDVLWPGDERGNGLLRRYTFLMINRVPGNDQTGRVRLERIGPNRTRLHFEERYNLKQLPWRWFEGPIYRFINRQNELSMQRLSAWLTAHPEYRPDLVESADAAPASDSERASG
jgi:hypothetical protein